LTAQKWSFVKWVRKVDRLCQQHLYCTWADLAGDPEPLVGGWKAGDSPEAFVRGQADRYDLEWRD
jgi:hypothetical protein